MSVRPGRGPSRPGRGSAAALAGALAALAAALPALAVALAAGLAAAPAAHAQQDPLEGKPIRLVRFVGSVRSSEAFLREQVRSKVGERFRAATLNEDVRRLYLSGRVAGDIEARPELIDGEVEITFFVNEREVVREIVYEGLGTFDEGDLDQYPSRLRLRRGRPYEEYRARLDERLIKERLATKGKLFAEIDRELVPLEGGGLRVIFHVREGPTVRVTDIRFVGNDSIEDDTLRKFMKTQTTVLYFVRSGYFEQQELDLDIERLKTYYRSEGFLDVRVFLDDLVFSADRTDVELVFRVVEGPRYRVRHVSVDGTELFTEEAILRDLSTKPGAVFSGRGLEEDLRSIERRYGNRGYIFAQARYDRRVVARPPRAPPPDGAPPGDGAGAPADAVEPGPQVDIAFEVEEGRAVSIERIRIEGNTKTREDVIRRELSILPGDAFSAEKLDESRDRLGRRGLFRDLQVRFEDGTREDRRDLVLRVEEGDTGQILLGGGISSSAGFFGRFVFQQRNFDITAVPLSLSDVLNGYAFAGAGQVFTLQAEPGTQRSSYRVSFLEPHLLPTVLPIPLQLRTSFTYSDSLLARTYIEERFEWAFGLGYRLSRDSIVEVGYRITSADIFDIDTIAPADVIEVAGENIVSAVSLGYRINKNQIDQYFLAYGGWGLDLVGEVAGGPFGGDHDFWQVRAEANWQTTLFQWPRQSRHVVQVRAGVGFGRAYGQSRRVPIFERFYAGGPRSLRGFEVRSVGPQADDEPLGGNIRMTGTIEYSFPIIPGFDETYAPQWRGDFLRGAFFVDGGAVEVDIEDLSTRDMRAAAGVGVRIKIPIFPQPLALDFAWPLRKLAFDDPEIFSLSIDVPF